MPHYGFNFLWMYSYGYNPVPQPADAKALDFLCEEGFDFVRIPLDYRFWSDPKTYQVRDESMLTHLDAYIQACQSRGLHCCINLHRAPGYCINGNHLESRNLWLDPVAQDAFVAQWQAFARRWKGIPSESLSFDLVNEPPEINQYGMTRENHAALVRRTVAAIHAVDPTRAIVIDGLGGGNLAMPELSDLPITQSGRGYQPMALTHYQATWWVGSKGLTPPKWPQCPSEGRIWTKETLVEHYKPWRDLEASGTRVHIGEFGCYNRVDNSTALDWFADLLNLFSQWRWGYSLWNFEGDFGIINHGRPNTRWESYRGYQVDRGLLELLQQHRVQ